MKIEPVNSHRWNIERDGSTLLICEGLHEKHEGCHYQRYIPEAQLATAVAAERERIAQMVLDGAGYSWDEIAAAIRSGAK